MSQVKALLGGRRTTYDGGLVLHWSPGEIRAVFRNGRSQGVRYEIGLDEVELVSTVATRGVLDALGRDRVAEEILVRNRLAEVVRFSIGKYSRLEASCSHRLSTLQPEELRFYVAVLAREADRLEYLLTGKDEH